jgi:hypothetical protein
MSVNSIVELVFETERSMNDSTADTRWFYRAALLVLFVSMAYVVTRAEYNYAHWIPHAFLRNLGVSYASLLWAERHGDLFLHFAGAFALVPLINFAALPVVSITPQRAFLAVALVCIAAELTQFLIGRGFETSDLLLGLLGSFMAYLAIDKKNNR